MKITIIELLNKIANKEGLPERIKYKGVIYGLKGTLYINDNETDRLMDFLYADFRNLNDEVEILEDEEIKELDKRRLDGLDGFTLIEIEEAYIDKINEIIRVVNKMQQDNKIK